MVLNKKYKSINFIPKGIFFDIFKLFWIDRKCAKKKVFFAKKNAIFAIF
jgi:hypothetical protein